MTYDALNYSEKMKRIFYFNITYGCNSDCIFCYSHNTWHNSKPHNEISFADFFDYLDAQNINARDRVIINGGEPFLHTEIENILSGLVSYDCEVLIYTNGRILSRYDMSHLPKQFRFIIPIHGYEVLHDNITGVRGSYRETLKTLNDLTQNTKCLVDIKIIINNSMLSEDYDGDLLINSLSDVSFNNAVHINKMADTIVSKKNKCKTISNDDAAYYTRLLFEYFKKFDRKIKIFDTCIKDIGFEAYGDYMKYKDNVRVYFKDKNQYREIDLFRNFTKCMQECICFDKCMSAVDEYKVLEYSNGKIYENLE